MIRFVEYNEAGDITHSCEIHTAEGVDAPPPVPEPLEEPTDPTERADRRAERQAFRAARRARISELIDQREKETIDALKLEAAKPGRRLLVLAKNAPPLDIETHKVDAGKIRARTPEERAARKAAQEAAANPPA